MTWDVLSSYITKPVLTTATFPESSINLEFILNLTQFVVKEWRPTKALVGQGKEITKFPLTRLPNDSRVKVATRPPPQQRLPLVGNGKGPSLQYGYDSGNEPGSAPQSRCQSRLGSLTQTQHGSCVTDTQPCCVHSGTTSSVAWFGCVVLVGDQGLSRSQGVENRTLQSTVCCYCTRTYSVSPSLHLTVSQGLGRGWLEFSRLL